MVSSPALERSLDMLFRKKIDRFCSYCSYGTNIGNDQVLCTKHGVVAQTYHCRKFTYDPCKRIPPKQKALDFSKYSDDDFSL